MKSIEIEQDGILISFDHISIPMDETLSIVEEKLLQDDDRLINRTLLSPKEIKQLLSLCLKTTNFKFRSSFYQLTDGVVMGSPASTPVASIFVEHFEQKAITALHRKPKIWKRFVDDVLTIIKHNDRQIVLNHLKNQHPNITCTYEEESNNQLPFNLWTYRSDDIEKDLLVSKFTKKRPTQGNTFLSIPTSYLSEDICCALTNWTCRTDCIQRPGLKNRDWENLLSVAIERLPIKVHQKRPQLNEEILQQHRYPALQGRSSGRDRQHTVHWRE